MVKAIFKGIVGAQPSTPQPGTPPANQPARGRASYRRGVAWIAWYDEPDQFDEDIVADSISTCLLADLFGKEPEEVARAIIRKRQQWLEAGRGY